MEGANDLIKLIPGNVDYTESGEKCKNKCGSDKLYNNRNWCWKTSGSWDYCNLGKTIEKMLIVLHYRKFIVIHSFYSILN